MKTREYIKSYRDNCEGGMNETTALKHLFAAMNRETLDLAVSRGGIRPSHTTLTGVLKEQDLKWRSIAHTLGLNPNGFREIFKEQGITY